MIVRFQAACGEKGQAATWQSKAGVERSFGRVGLYRESVAVVVGASDHLTVSTIYDVREDAIIIIIYNNPIL